MKLLEVLQYIAIYCNSIYCVLKQYCNNYCIISMNNNIAIYFYGTLYIFDLCVCARAADIFLAVFKGHPFYLGLMGFSLHLANFSCYILN
jgi:hypothetical protein